MIDGALTDRGSVSVYLGLFYVPPPSRGASKSSGRPPPGRDAIATSPGERLAVLAAILAEHA